MWRTWSFYLDCNLKNFSSTIDILLFNPNIYCRLWQWGDTTGPNLPDNNATLWFQLARSDIGQDSWVGAEVCKLTLVVIDAEFLWISCRKMWGKNCYSRLLLSLWSLWSCQLCLHKRSKTPNSRNRNYSTVPILLLRWLFILHGTQLTEMK